MRVAVIPSDTGACFYNRAAWPAQQVINETGWKVELYHPGRVSLGGPGVVVKGIPDVDGLDLVIFQRLASPRQVEFVGALQAMGIATVVDVDDALWRIDPDNASYDRWTEKVDGWRRYEHLDAACQLADLVTVSTPVLARRYGAHGRVEVIRNGLPNVAFRKDMKPGFQGGRIRIGWSGSLDSHPNDLQVMGDAVARVIQENDDVDLHIVGNHEPIAGLLGVPQDRATGTGWVPIDQYHQALQGIDIMVVPLADTLFNRAKSALKAQEGVAAGALVVASGTPENQRLMRAHALYGAIQPGAGSATWKKKLDGAIDARREGYVTADPYTVRHLAYEGRGMEWARAWQTAVDTRKGSKN